MLVKIALFTVMLLVAGVAHAEDRHIVGNDAIWQDKAYPLIATNSIDGSVLSSGRNQQGIKVPVVVATRRNDDGSFTRTVTDADGHTTTSTFGR